MRKRSNKILRKKSPKRKMKNFCDHSHNFSCHYYEKTIIINGKKHHKTQNICKCYDCGMEFTN